MQTKRYVSPLYPEEGAPCLGFCCRFELLDSRENIKECGQLFKTEIGAWNHLEQTHGIKREPELPVEETAKEISLAKPSPESA